MGKSDGKTYIYGSELESEVQRRKVRWENIMFFGKQTGLKVLCNICNFQELSEDAKVLVDAYGENSGAKIVFAQKLLFTDASFQGRETTLTSGQRPWSLTLQLFSAEL